MDVERNHAAKAEAEVTAVEAHPKRPGMYRVALRLKDGQLRADCRSVEESTEPAADWHEEVDGLIASAAACAPSPEGEAVITVHEDTLVAMRLLKGRRLTAEEWEALRTEASKEDAYRAALAILERKARTSRELADALKRKGYPADIIRGCVERLQSRRMLDDSSYARRYAEQKAAGQRKGRRLIRQELLQRGVAKSDADQALDALDEGVEQEAANALARKKFPQIKGELRERKMKLTAFLLRRGYANRVVRTAVHLAAEEADSREYGEDFDWTNDGE